MSSKLGQTVRFHRKFNDKNGKAVFTKGEGMVLWKKGREMLVGLTVPEYHWLHTNDPEWDGNVVRLTETDIV